VTTSSLGQTRCDCGALRVVLDPSVPCLACESYAAVRSASFLTYAEMWHLCSLAGRQHYPALLNEAWEFGVIDTMTLTGMVAEAWCMVEFPDRALDWYQWEDLFVAAGYTVDGKPARRPRKPLRLYRAAPEEYRYGHSWTEDVEVAESFLTTGGRFLLEPKLWQANVEPRRLLARMWRARESNGEPQYVIDTEGLDLTEVES
jgi:hypothetical protein